MPSQNRQQVRTHASSGTGSLGGVMPLDLSTLPNRLVQTPIGTVVVLEQLGAGTAASVFRAQHLRTKTLYALKVISDVRNVHKLKDSEPFYEFVAHRAVHEHENVVSLITSFDIAGHTAFLLEYADSGDLLQHLMANPGGFSEIVAKDFFFQVVGAVLYAHERGVMHRDIKLENILLQRDASRPSGFRALLADWGYATPLVPGRCMRDSCGSLHYCAPEVLSGRAYKGASSDSWSLGVLLYALLSGRFPFFGRKSCEIVQRIHEGLPIAPRPAPIPREAWALIHQCLLASPNARITCSSIRSHRWLRTDSLHHLRNGRRLNSDMGISRPSMRPVAAAPRPPAASADILAASGVDSRARTAGLKPSMEETSSMDVSTTQATTASKESSDDEPMSASQADGDASTRHGRSHSRFLREHHRAVRSFRSSLARLKGTRLGSELIQSPRLY